jgi:acyl carrier protein
MNATIEDIKNLVSLTLGIRNVQPEHRIIEDLGAESADVANILAAVEDKFQIQIREEDIPDIRTVADLHARVQPEK